MLINISPFQPSDSLLFKWLFTLSKPSNSNNVIIRVQAASEFLEAGSDGPMWMGGCSYPLLIKCFIFACNCGRMEMVLRSLAVRLQQMAATYV